MNSAYVFPKKFPTSAQIDADVREIVARKFPEFVVHFHEKEVAWTVQYKKAAYKVATTRQIGFLRYDAANPGLIEYLCLILRLSKWNRRKCIEFQHGHSYDILWWLEYEIREELALMYKAKTADDAISGYHEPQIERFANYKEYLLFVYEHRLITKVDFWRKHLNQILNICRETLPKNLHYLVGTSIKKVKT